MKAVQGVNRGLLATHRGQNNRDDGIMLSIAMLAFAEVGFDCCNIAPETRVDDNAMTAPLWPK